MSAGSQENSLNHKLNILDMNTCNFVFLLIDHDDDGII